MKIDRLILCIDEERRCAEEPLEHLGAVIRYRRRLDPLAVLAIVDPAWIKHGAAVLPVRKTARKVSQRTRGASGHDGS